MVCADVSLEDLLAFHIPIDDMAFEAGATIYNMADHANAVYCVRQGAIKLLRYDVSGNQRQLIADQSLPAATLDALRAEFNVTTARRQPHPFAFACPAGVERTAGLNRGCTETASPWGDAVAERMG